MKKVKLTERQINKAINEISYNKVQSASDRSNDLFYDLIDSFSTFYNDLNDFCRFTGKNNREWLETIADKNPYIEEIRKHAEIIKSILSKKEAQRDYFDNNLNDFDNESYFDSEEGQFDDYDDKDLRYLQNKYPKNNV